MKRYFLLFAMIVLLFCSCDKKSTDNETFSFLFPNDVTVTLGEVADIPALLGEPLSATEAPNCLRGGTDTLYRYDGWEITCHTEENGTEKKVSSVVLLNGEASTAEGVRVGSEEKSIAVYGAVVYDNGRYTVTRGNDTLSFNASEGVFVSVIGAVDTAEE